MVSPLGPASVTALGGRVQYPYSVCSASKASAKNVTSLLASNIKLTMLLSKGGWLQKGGRISI